MDTAANLILARNAPAFPPALLAYLGLGGELEGKHDWPRVLRIEAEQIPLAAQKSPQVLETLCHEGRVDHAWLPAKLRRLEDFKLLALDMDSTLITIECIDELGDWCGRKADIAAITEAAMRGEIADYAESLRRRVALLAGLDVRALESVYQERLQLSPGAEILLDQAKASGLQTLLVSGGFTFFTDRLRERLGLDHTRSNQLEIVDGRLTGRVLGAIVDAEAKAAELRRICDALGISTAQAIAIGDGANDLKMLACAGLGVAYHAKPVVAAQASLAIRFGGLDRLLDFVPASASEG